MKKFFSILFIFCLGFLGLLAGCNEDRYGNLTITIATEQERAEDGSITLYVGDSPEDITVTMGGIPSNFNVVPSFSLSENIVKIGEVNHMLDNGVRKTIEGIAPGYTVLTAYTSEGLKSASLKINVIKKAESISANSDYKLAVIRRPGYSTKIDTNEAISILPKDSNQNTIKYSLATEGLTDVISLRDNTITVLEGASLSAEREFQIKAEVVNHKGEVNENVDPTYLNVRILDDITTEDIKLYQSQTQNPPINALNAIENTLILSKNYVENNITYVFIAVKTSETIGIIAPENTNASPVLVSYVQKFTSAGYQFFEYRLQAIRYSQETTLNFGIYVDGYKDAYTFNTEIKVECQLYIKSFSVNDTTLADGAKHNITLYTNEQTAGAKVKIAVSNPREILAKDARFSVALYNVETGEMVSYDNVSNYFSITNVVNNSRLNDGWYMKEVTFNVRLQAGNLGIDDSGKYELIITSERPLMYETKAKTSILINIVEGIKTIDNISYGGETHENEPIRIKYEKDATPLEVTLNTTPDSATAFETLYATSSNSSIVRVEKVSAYSNKFKIYPVKVGEADVVFGSKNLTSTLTYRVSVYDDIDDFYVSIDEFSQSKYIGKSTVSGYNLTSAVIKVNNASSSSAEIKLNINVIPATAQYYTVKYEVKKVGATENLASDGTYIYDDYFRLNTRKNTFQFIKHNANDKYLVTVVLENYDGSTTSKQFEISSYIPITYINMTLTQEVLYNPNNLSYFDLNNASKSYTKTQATVSVNRDATYGYKENIFYEVVVDGTVNENILLRTDNLFELNKNFNIGTYPKKVYITAYALEFGEKRVEVTKQITIHNPVTVEDMAVEGDINGDILYFKLGVDNTKDIKVTVNPSVNLFNSNIKWVQYAEGTTTVLDFADNGGGVMTSVDTESAIFSVQANGNNRFTISAKKAGNARLLLIPEDKIKDVNGSKYIYNWDKTIELFVQVADGSKENPYHVANLQDFRAIQNAMDKYYVLTSNITAEDNWSPLGLDTLTPLTGGIKGLYSRIIDAEAGTKYTVQYEISNVSFATSMPTGQQYFGLIYQLGNADNLEAELDHMVVKYNYIQAEFNSNLTFGGLVAINYGKVLNSKVKMNNIAVGLGGLSADFGGIVGKNYGDIDNSEIDNSIDISATITIKNGANQINFVSINVGGIAGLVASGTINGSQKDYTEVLARDVSFGDQGYDVMANIKVVAEATLDASLKDKIAVGGVCGNISNTNSTKVFVNDFAVTGSITADIASNVGGIVGKINAEKYKNKAEESIAVTVFNCLGNARITGNINVGGVIGYAVNANISYCSAENYRDTQTTKRPFVTGSSYVGGFAGYVASSNIDHSYFVTYFENAGDFNSEKITESNSDIVVTGDTAYVGGFIASIELADDNIISSVAFIGNIYVKAADKSNSSGFVGWYNGSGQISNIVVRGWGSQGMSSTRGSSSAVITGNYYSTFNNPNTVASIGDVFDKNGTFTDESVWKTTSTINDNLPYLIDGQGNILFAFLPIDINVEIIKNGEGLNPDKEDSIRNDGYIALDDPNKVVVLYLNELNSGALTAEQLLALNTYKITDFANITIDPLTLKTLRLTISSNNNTVVRIDNDKLIVLKEGYARITIASKLNADYKAEFIVVVKRGFNEYGLYESSNMTADAIVKDNIDEPVKIIVNKVKALYEKASYDRVVDGNKYSLITSSDVYVKYTLESDDYVDAFIINTNWQRTGSNPYTEVHINNLTSIFAKAVLKKRNAMGQDVNVGPIKVTAVPFVNYTYFGTSYTYTYDYLSYSFYVEIFNGASNISFESNSTNVEITQLQSFIYGVVMDTDTIEDEIKYYVEYNGKIVDLNATTEESMINITKNAVTNETIFDTDGISVKGKYNKYTVSFENSTEVIKENKVFKITYYSSLVPEITATMTITVVPQNIVSADIGLYSNKDSYNKNKDGTETFLFNGQVGLLTVEIYPDFSKFDRFDITYTSSNGTSLSINQLKYNKNATETDDPFTDYKDSGSQYVIGYGIKVAKASGAEPLLGSDSGIYSYSKIFYFSLLIGSNVPDLTVYTVNLTFFSDNEVVEPKNVSYTFRSLSAPTLSLGVKDESLKGLLPLGTKNELNVIASNFTGDIEWKAEIELGNSTAPIKCADGEDCGKCITCLNKNYALLESLIPTKDADGKYYLTIPADNFELIGKRIKITASITKSENNETFNKTESMSVDVTLFTVTGMGVEGLSQDMLKLPIYTPYSLKVTLDAVYSEDVKYENYEGNAGRYTVANLISKLKEQISMADVWNLVLEKSTNEEESPSTLQKLVKNNSVLYNAAFECISYGDYFALYGNTVDIISTLRAVANISYVDGMPTFVTDGTGTTYSKQFSCAFTYQNDIKNPIPISSQEEFEAMEEGKDYRLVKDIMLTNYNPINTRILSLDGNGYTIYISSFADGITNINLGLFGTVEGADSTHEATMIYNVTVYYLQNTVVEETVAEGGNIVESYSPPNIRNHAELNLTGHSEYNFGGIAGINRGVITNCEVNGLIVINADNDILSSAYVGGLVGQNDGYITNSRVYDFSMSAAGNIGGVAGINTKTISSTYTNEMDINNYSTNTQLFYTGGFVCENEEDALILESYAQGRRNDRDVTFVNTYNSLVTSGTAGGFAYRNAGKITDCYSNICINASAFSAGFIFLNEDNAVIDKCYSISRVAFNSRAASPFTGIGKSGGVTVSYSGTISNCYFLTDRYNVFSNEPAIALSQKDFNSSSSFNGYNFRYNTSDPKEAEGYTWYIAEGRPRLTQTDIKTYSRYIYAGKSKNYIADSEIYFKYKQDEHKWYAYNAQSGYDTSKEMVISRRATTIFYERVNGTDVLRYYFKKAYDASGKQLYKEENGKQYALYEVDDPTLAGNKYFLNSDNNKMLFNGAGTDVLDKALNVTFAYYDEIYTEENGNIQVGTEGGEGKSLWKNITTDEICYYIEDAKTPYITPNVGGVATTDSIRYIDNIEIISVLYKDGSGSSLVDLSVDDNGQCDFTYIKTQEELGIKDSGTVPYINLNYGGGYSYRKLDSVIYKYANGDGEVMGSKTNPYLIYDTVSYNTYFKDKFSGRASLSDANRREYYRLVSDIDFSFKQISTSNRTLFGYVEGNGMVIKNITLTYVSGDEETTAFGLFAQSFDSIVNNLTLNIIEIASSAHTYVGGLVGWARTDHTESSSNAMFNGYEIQNFDGVADYLKRNYFNNVVISKVDENSTTLTNTGLVLGRNFVGGLVGFATGETRINNIDVNINVNSVYVQDATSAGKYITYQRLNDGDDSSSVKALFDNTEELSNNEAVNYYLNRRLSYAGLVVGVLDCDKPTDEDKANIEEYTANALFVHGKFTAAGFIMGGVIGLVAKENVVQNINVTLQTEQSIRGTLYTGGLVGENRGTITTSTIAYETDKENEIAPVSTARANTVFFNNNMPTVAIGGLVGFNNGGEINSSISHVDVRNPLATIAGGAVGRSISGIYNKVIVTGSVRAKSIMGGFVGTVNSTIIYTGKNGIGRKEQVDVYPDDRSYSSLKPNANPDEWSPNPEDTYIADKYTSCIAANNWLLDDYPYLTEKKNVKRVAGGFIGSEALTTEYFKNLDDTDKKVSDIRTKSTKLYSSFIGCYYTNSLYYGSTGENVAPSAYMPIGYISAFDDVKLFSTKYSETTEDYDMYEYLYPYLAINETNSTSGIYGVTHYEMAYGTVTEYNGDKLVLSVESNTTFKAEYELGLLSDIDTKQTHNNYVNRISKTARGKSMTLTDVNVGGTSVDKKVIYNFSGLRENERNSNGMTLVIERDDLNKIKSKSLKIVEKYNIYSAFADDVDFKIDESTFYNGLNEESRSMYPKVKINTIGLSWDKYAGTEFSKDENGYFLIENARDLATLASVVNSNSTYQEDGSTKYYNRAKYGLTTDIDISGKEWKPIGIGVNHFYGEFDGNNHTIRGALANNYYESGIFGRITTATIKNLVAESGTISGDIAGGIVGFSQSSTITNCINSNTVIGNQYSGGIVGQSLSSILTNCYNKGKVSINENDMEYVDSYVGGIIGFSSGDTITYTSGLETAKVVNSGDIEVTNNKTSYTSSSNAKGSVFVGGFVGYMDSGLFSITSKQYIYNEGNITVDSNAHMMYVGGAFGRLIASGVTSSNASDYQISYIRNNGDISVSDSNTFSTLDSRDYYVPRFAGNSDSSIGVSADIALAYVGIGGVVGSYYCPNATAESKCGRIGLLANNGSIFFDNQMSSKCIGGVGGVIGSIDSINTNIDQSYNTGKVEVRVNAGKTNINLGVGGILGFAVAPTTPGGFNYNKITNCYNMGSISSNGEGGVWSGGISGITALVKGGQYALGNESEILPQGINGSASDKVIITDISYCYNTGSVTGENNNVYGKGALAGYGAGTNCETGGSHYNYYLAGSAEYAFASFTKSLDTTTGAESEQSNFAYNLKNNYSQRTSNTLKLNGVEVGVMFNNDIWAQEVTTWYPTLKSNYEVLYWDDNYEPLSVEGESFTIDSAEKLAYLSYAVNNGILSTQNIKFVLKDNIDMANRYFTPIGNADFAFCGEFDGNGYSIKNITINAGSALNIKEGSADSLSTVGSLFGYVNGGKIKNTGLESPIISGVDYASGFAYSMTNGSEMQYCYLDSFRITDPDAIDALGKDDPKLYKKGDISGYKMVAGFANILNSSNISRSYVNVNIGTRVGKSGSYKGYLAGFANDISTSVIEDCYVGQGISGSYIYSYETTDNTTSSDIKSSNMFNVAINKENGMLVGTKGEIIDGASGEKCTSIVHCFNLSSNIMVKGFNSSCELINESMIADATTISFSENIESIPTSALLEQNGWDVISVWSYEYSLHGDSSSEESFPATIRGLGQNWYNTECVDLSLKNVVGDSIDDIEKVDITGNKRFFIYYEIYTPEQLAWIARMVNTGKLSGKDSGGNQYVVKLMNDIDLKGRTWTPIGTLDHPFACKFDFNGYDISNLVMDTTNINFAGLFGYTNGAYITGGTISNEYINVEFTDEDANNQAVIKSLYIGGLVGRGHNTQIEDITIEANMVGYSKYNCYVGGVAGSLTYGKASENEGLTSSVSNVKVITKESQGIESSEVLIPKEYRLENGFGLDEVLTGATQDNAIGVNIGGFSNAGNSYVGGIVGYIAGKYTKTYQTQAVIRKALNRANVVAYTRSDISRTYNGGIAGYMTENSLLEITENIGRLKSATYGFDYIGGIAGMIDGSSEIINSVNKGELECSQFASVLSYSGGIGGFLRGGSNVSYSANVGSSYKNVDSTKIFSAGAFGYVERDATGAMPTVKYVVFSDNSECYKFDGENSIGYYGDGELTPAEEGQFTILCITSMQDVTISGIFDTSIWNLVTQDVDYNTRYALEFDSSLLSAYYVQESDGENTYAPVNSGANLPVGTEIIFVIKSSEGLANKNIVIRVDGVDVNFDLTLAATVGNGTITSIDESDSAVKNAIRIKLPSNGLSNVTVSTKA